VSAPLLKVTGLKKTHTRGVFKRQETFRLEADFEFPAAKIIGVMGPNGSGKTTLFELIAGSNLPTAGEVLCGGQDIHKVKYRQRDRLAIHYHQSYQVRHFAKRLPSFMLQRPKTDYPDIHLFDEPQFSIQDGYIGFMLEFFKRLRNEGRLVMLSVHPQERFHIEIMKSICEEFLFIREGRVTRAADYGSLLLVDGVRAYLGKLGTV
jgi:ABC-2 type transport system ATP-binding protein